VRSLVINSGGLGDTGNVAQTFELPFTTLTPGSIDICNSWAYWVTIPCWSLSQSAWAEAAALPAIPASVVAAPAAPASVYTNPNQVAPDTTGQTSQDLSNQAIQQTQANVQAFVSGVPDNPLGTDACETFTANWPAPFDGLTCPTVLLYGVGIVAAVLIFQKVLGKL